MKHWATRFATTFAVVAISTAAGCSQPANEDAEAEHAVVPVRVAGIEWRTFADVLEAPGQWHSSGDVVVPAPFAAVVESRGPRPGDRVVAGEVLGVLMTRESRSALRGAELLAREAKDPGARAEAERALALAQRDLVRVPFIAPRAGLVTRRGAEPGAELAEGAELLAITPPEAIVFEARVPAVRAARVRVGDAAIVRVDGEASRAVRVTRVLPAAGAADQATLVWLTQTGGADRREAPGSGPVLERFGTAELRTSGARRSLAVPVTAVVENDLDGRSRVAVVGADSAVVWTTVTLGAETGGWRELLQPTMSPGTRVVIEGQRGLPEHARVKPDSSR